MDREIIIGRLTDLLDEIKECLTLLLKPVNWWIFLPTFFAVVSVYSAYNYKITMFLDKGIHEKAALFILGTTIILLAFASLKYRSFGTAFLLVLAVNFLIRELDSTLINMPDGIHFKLKTKAYIGIALAAMGIWAFWKEKQLIQFFRDNPAVKIMFIGVFIAYVNSQIFAQRIFKHIRILPYEQKLHVPLEEITENAAHLFFFATAAVIIISLYRHHKTESINNNQSVSEEGSE